VKFKRTGSAVRNLWSTCKQYYVKNSIIVVVIIKLLEKIKSLLILGGIMKIAPYIWYSGPTDATGQLLAKELKATHGKTKPTGTGKLCICWGTKTDKQVNMGTIPVLNHPDKIKANRHKYNTLVALAKAGVYVGSFCSVKEILTALSKPTGHEPMAVPVIGRRNYHQGGEDFHTCLTIGHVKKAIDLGATYFRNYMDVKDEYRLHVFQGAVINAQKKTERSDMKKAFAEQFSDKIKNNAAKTGKKLDEATIKHVLEDIGGRQGHANQIIKSNTRGWKFSQIKLTSLNKDLQDLAVRAVEASGLDFAAVDCVMLENGKPAIIELNTGPGLEGSSFNAYVAVFNEAVKVANAPKKAAPAMEPAQTKTDKKRTAPVGGRRIRADADKLRLLADMMDKADEGEKEVLDSVFAKMFS
jgi:hypothetical protein